MEPSWYPGETLVSLNLEMGDGRQRSQESTVMASGRLMGWQVVSGKWHSVLTGTSVRTRKSAHVGSYQVWDPLRTVFFRSWRLLWIRACDCVDTSARTQLSLLKTVRKASLHKAEITNEVNSR